MFVSGVLQIHEVENLPEQIPDSIRQEFIRSVFRNEPFVQEKIIHNFLIRFTSPSATDYRALKEVQGENYEDFLLVALLESITHKGRLVYERDIKLPMQERLQKLLVALGNSAAIPLIVYEAVQFARMFFALLKEAYSFDFFTKTPIGE